MAVTWIDSSGLGNNATHATDSEAPTVVANILNGYEVRRFATNDRLNVAIPLPNPATILVVYANRTGTNGCLYSTDVASASGRPLQRDTIVYFASNATGQTFSGSDTLNANNLFTAQSNYTTDVFESWLDGTQRTTDDAIARINSGNIRIGCVGDGSEFLAGDIAEFLIFDSTLSTANRQGVETYLGTKYALTLGHSATSVDPAGLSGKKLWLQPKATRTTTHSADLIAVSVAEVSHGADLIVVAGPTEVEVSHAADLIAVAVTEVSHSADLSAAGVVDVSHAADLIAAPGPEWWNDTTGEWQTTEVFNVGSVDDESFDAFPWAEGNYEWSVATKDAAGETGPYATPVAVTVVAGSAGAIVSHGADLVTLAKSEVSHSADLIAVATTAVSHGADLIALATFEVSHSADLVASLETTLEHSADLLVLLESTVQHSADLVTPMVVTATHGADLIATSTVEKSHGADLIARATSVTTHGADLIARATSVVTHGADLIADSIDVITHGADLIAAKVPTIQHGADLRVIGDTAVGPTSEDTVGLRHEFTAADGSTLRLPITAMPGQELVKGFQAKGEAPGGFMGATAEISQAIYDANPGVFIWGTEWLVWNDDGPSGLVWAGHLNDPQVIGGSVLLHGEGTGQRADKVFEQILGQTRDEDRWTTADSDPHNYDVDSQINADVDGRRLRFRVKRKEQFLRANGRAVLNGGVDKGDESITMSVNGGGLVDGEKIHIGGETRVVKNTYTPGSTTVPITEALSHHHDNGEKVSWHASGNPSQWDTGLVFWYPETDLSRIYFEIEKERSTGTYDLQLLKGTGPDGSLTLVKTCSLATGQPITIDEPLGGSPDLLVLRMRRQSHTERARAFKCIVKDIRVNGFSTADNCPTSEIVEYIAGRVKASDSTAGIQTTTTNGFPLDAEDASAGQILDELALLDDFMWAREHNGTVPEWHYQAWDHRTYVLTDEHAPVSLVPLERFNKVRVPHRYPGGVKAYVTMTADPNPLPGEFNTLQIDLDDPLPPEDISEALGQNLANYMSLKRFGGTAVFSYLEKPLGTRVQATKIRAGDTLRLANYDNIELRVVDVQYGDVSVTVTFAETHPLLERILARRTLMLARGRSNASATLGGFDLAHPAVPANVQMGFFEADRRGGKRRFNGRMKWDEVTEDLDGNATAIKKYLTKWRPVDPDTGEPVPESQGGGIIEKTVDKKDLDDPEIDELPTHELLRNLEKPHKWKWQGKAAAVDVLGQPSDFSAWTVASRPAAFGPPDPTSVSLDVDQHWAKGRIKFPDPDETDADGTPSLDRRVKGVKWKLLKSGVQVYPPNVEWAFSKGGEYRTRVNQPRSATYQIRAKTIDYYGNESAVVSQTNVRGVPPDPTNPPNVSIDKGGRKKRRITVTGTYAGAYTDDDIRGVIVKAVIGGQTTRPRIQIEDDGTFSHVFRGQDKGDSYDISFRVVDDDGKRSGFSPSATGVVNDKTPGKVRNKQINSKTRAIVVKYDPPNAWSDGSTTDWSIEEVQHYAIVVRNTFGTEVARDDQAKTTRKVFPFTRAEISALSLPLKADVTAVGFNGDDAGAETTAALGSPEDKRHTHGAGGHTHGGGTHRHFKGQHQHGKGHKHSWKHGHRFSGHSGHGHGFVSQGSHGHGGATSGFSANPGNAGQHNHVISTAADHAHSFSPGGAHDHGQVLESNDQFTGGGVASLFIEGESTGPDSMKQPDTGPQTDFDAPSDTGDASSGTTAPGSGNSDLDAEI